jgi:hypothetical protein
MSDIVVRGRSVRVLCRLLLFIAFLMLGCETNAGKGHGSGGAPAASGVVADAAAAGADGSPPASCKKKCGATCDVDDGCGGKCACKSGKSCQSGVCVDEACGPCRPNEACTNGKCECVPDCTNRACQDDGCGALCPCPDNTGVNAQGQSVPLDQCQDSCKQVGWSCGTLCGVDCGRCSAGQLCKTGRCECEPRCDGSSCDDGCGGSCDCAANTVCNAANVCLSPDKCTDTCESAGLTCGSVCGKACGECGASQACISGQCREAVSCKDCVLKLRLLERTVINSKIVRVKLEITTDFPDAVPGPRLIDIRIVADKSAQLVDAQAGPALQQTGKDLFMDESTHEPWQELGDRSYQLLAYNVTGTLRVASGSLLTATFDLAEAGPVKFSIVRHNQTFAPLDMDNVLQASTYDDAVTVTR